MPTTPIYAHKADEDGRFIHCTYGISFALAESLKSPRGRKPPLEYIEGKFLKQDWAESVIEEIPTEDDRETDAIRVGTLEYSTEKSKVTDVSFSRPNTDSKSHGS